jgi:hypothetical protein
MMPKFAKEDANKALYRLDRAAAMIKANHKTWGMPFETAKSLVNAIDQTLDEIEVAAFGAESLAERQVEVVKQLTAAAQQRQAGAPAGGTERRAEVVHREPDEPYMDTFKNTMAPIQTEADEPYMKAYGMPDQSSDMIHGVSTTGRPLTPHKNDTPSPV